jgi:hypothetical protein
MARHRKRLTRRYLGRLGRYEIEAVVHKRSIEKDTEDILYFDKHRKKYKL